MNLLYLNLYSDLGGGELSLLHLAQLLDRKIKPLFLFARPGSFSRRLDAMGAETLMVDYAPAMVSRLWLPSLFFKNLRAGFALSRLIRERRIDVVHCTDLFSLLLLLPAFFSTRIPIVYNVIMFYNRPQSLLFRWLSSMMVKRIVAPSHAIRNDLVERVGIGNERIEVLHNGVDASAFTPAPAGEKERIRKEFGIPPDRKVIGFAGRYEVWKGHATLLDAVTLLANSKFQNRPRLPAWRRSLRQAGTSFVSGGDFENPVTLFDGVIKQIPNLQSSIYNLQFLLAGGSPTEDVVKGVTRYRENLEPAFRDLERKGVLRRLGHWDDMPAFYAALDLFVCPSDKEAFGLVVLEAFAAGLPVVVTNTTAAGEIVGSAKGGYQVEPKNSVALVEAIQEALQKGKSEVDLDERRVILADCTWEKYARNWEALYEGGMGRAKGRDE